MSDDTKMLDPAALAGLTTGVLLTGFSALHEAAEQVIGHPIWSHEFGSKETSDALRDAVLGQFPDMPVSIAPEGWEYTRDAVRSQFGTAVIVQKGSSTRTKHPVDTLNDMLGDRS